MLSNFVCFCPGLCSSADWAWATNQRVASLIPGQGTCLGCGPGPQWGPCERQPHIDVSLPFFLPSFPLSKNKLIKLKIFLFVSFFPLWLSWIASELLLGRTWTSEVQVSLHFLVFSLYFLLLDFSSFLSDYRLISRPTIHFATLPITYYLKPMF